MLLFFASAGERRAIGVQLLSCALLLWAAGGCGSQRPEGQLPTVAVKGRVLLNGKSAEGVRVVLSPTDAKLQAAKWPNGFPKGTVTADGTCVFSTYADQDGAPAGEYVVLIQKFVPANSESGDDDEAQQVDIFNGKYSKTSPWKVSVSNGPTELKPIELTIR